MRGICEIEAVNPDGEDGVTAGRLQVQFVCGIDAIFESGLEVSQQFCLVLTLKKEQILYSKLLVFAPPQPQPLQLRRAHRQRLVVERGRVEQVVDFLTVNLQERDRDSIAPRRFQPTDFVE